MTDREIAQRAMAALIDELGGPEVEAMIDAHYRQGRTLAEIGREHGTSASTVHRRIHRMRAVLASFGLLADVYRSRDRVRVPHLRNNSINACRPS